jgi:hypothetical protein
MGLLLNPGEPRRLTRWLSVSNLDYKLHLLRQWLRYHADYGVTIEVWGLFGCYVVRLTYLNDVKYTSRGETLIKRIDDILEQVKAIP